MINAIGIALGGLAAATEKVGKAATNIANVQTPGYVPEGKASGPVDLAEEAVNLKIGEIAFKANLATIKTADEMSEELFRIFDETV